MAAPSSEPTAEIKVEATHAVNAKPAKPILVPRMPRLTGKAAKNRLPNKKDSRLTALFNDPVPALAAGMNDNLAGRFLYQGELLNPSVGISAVGTKIEDPKPDAADKQ